MTANSVTRQPAAGDRLALLRSDLEELVRDGDQVAPMIFDNLAWLASMEDAGFVIDLATGMPAGFDPTLARGSRP